MSRKGVVGQQHQIGGPVPFRTSDFAKRCFVTRFAPVQLHRADGFEASVTVVDELFSENAESARILTMFGTGFFMRILHAKHARPLGPRIFRRPAVWRFVQQLEVDDACAAMTQ